MYGAGQKHSIQILLQNNPGMGKQEADAKVKNLFKLTKGMKKFSNGRSYYWYGGTESFMFNVLENAASSESPHTPVLGCEIPGWSDVFISFRLLIC